MTVLVVLLTHRGPAPSGGTGLSGGAGPTGAPAVTASAAIGPVDVTAPPASAAADQHCPGVISDLPVTLNGSHSRPAHSTSAYVAAWGDPPMVLRCGVPRPAGFVRTSMVISIDGVQWFTEQKPDAVVWTAVDRPVYVEVTVPTTYGSAPIADLSEDLGKALPAQPIKPGA